MDGVSEIMDELGKELDGKKSFLNKKVDITRCQELYEELKNSFGGLISESEAIVKSRTAILENADSVAKNMLKEAEQRAKHMAQTSEVIRIAEKGGKDIEEAAYKRSDILLQKTKDRLDELFRDAETFFSETLEVIRKNRMELRGAFSGEKEGG